MSRPYPLTSTGFWRGYWVTLRPYLFFVSGAAGAVGLAAPSLPWDRFAAGFAAFFFSYGLGQALTDVFQTDTDALSSPYRPLTQGKLSKAIVLLVSLAGLGMCMTILILLNPWTIPFSLLTVIGLLTYTPFKRRWWGGPFWNAWIVALLPAIGALCGGDSLKSLLTRPVLGFAMLSVFCSYAVFVLLGYFKDLSADRATGYDTLPVRAGWGVSVLVSAGFALAAITASASVIFRTGGTVVASGLWALAALSFGFAHGGMAALRDEAKAHGPIAWSVRGFVLLHAGEAAALRPSLAIPAILFCLAFEAALALRPEKTQI